MLLLRMCMLQIIFYGSYALILYQVSHQSQMFGKRIWYIFGEIIWTALHHPWFHLQYIPWNMHNVDILLWFVVVTYQYILPISFRVTLLALGQS